MLHFFVQIFVYLIFLQYLCTLFRVKSTSFIINPGMDSRNPTPIKQHKQMATKIRLARYGHKDYAFYHIVVANSRAPRDGKFIERIGSYNPNTNPGTVILNFERALYWIGVGAEPTDTVRTILSNEGVLLMKHLNGGVAKGAFSQEEAQKDAKNGKISQAEADKKAAAAKALLAQEVETNKAKAAALAEKRAAAAAELAAAAQEAAQEAAAAEAEANGEAPAEAEA